MTRDEYYEILEQAWKAVDQESLASIKAYNEMRRQLRKELEEDDSDGIYKG